jgi:hypothetical protein
MVTFVQYGHQSDTVISTRVTTTSTLRSRNGDFCLEFINIEESFRVGMVTAMGGGPRVRGETLSACGVRKRQLGGPRC